MPNESGYLKISWAVFDSLQILNWISEVTVI